MPDGLFYRNTEAPFLLDVQKQALVFAKEQYQYQPLPLADLFSNPLLSASSPAGAVIPYAGAAAPAGWLECNGAAISRTAYATLFAAIGILWGAGDGVNTFNLPDARGRFLRGAGNSGNGTMANGAAFPGGAAGSYANDQLQGHIHRTGAATMQIGTGYDVADTVASPYPATGAKFMSVPAPDATNGTPRTGPESKPAAAAMMMIIKT